MSFCIASGWAQRGQPKCEIGDEWTLSRGKSLSLELRTTAECAGRFVFDAPLSVV